MKRAALVLSLALAACNTPRATPRHRAPIELTIASVALGEPRRVRVLLPDGYATSTARYPVLYLLHGLYGDHTNWTEHTRLTALTAHLPLIVVMPEAKDSWYAGGTEAFVAHELVDRIDATYRTVPERRARAIAGLSMGGYGALKLALRRPWRYAFAGSLSGAFDGPRGLEARFPDFAPSLSAAFGPSDAPSRRDEDVHLLIPRAEDPLAALYLDCGLDDPFLDSNRAIARALTARGAHHAVHEVAGAHDWAYWDARLPHLLDAVARALGVARAP